MIPKKTLIIGASTNKERYSNMAISLLRLHKNPVVAIGNKPGTVDDVVFDTEPLLYEAIDTVSLYVGPKHQSQYYNYIIGLHPKRIIFNPGTENEELEKLATENNIETMEACTLVMLKTGQY